MISITAEVIFLISGTKSLVKFSITLGSACQKKKQKKLRLMF